MMIKGLIWHKNFTVRSKEQFDAAQKFIDSECLRHCDRYVPMRTGMLKKSGILGTVIGSGKLEYNATYARQQYYTNAGRGMQGTSNGGVRGKLWFERMKADHKDEILQGAKEKFK